MWLSSTRLRELPSSLAITVVECLTGLDGQTARLTVVMFGTLTRPRWPPEPAYALLEFLELLDLDDVDACGYVDGVEDLGAMMASEAMPPFVAPGPQCVAVASEGAISRLAFDGTVIDTVTVPGRPEGLGVDAQGRWVAVFGGAEAVRLCWQGLSLESALQLPLSAWPQERAPVIDDSDLVFLAPASEVLGCTPAGVRFRFSRNGTTQGLLGGHGQLLLEHDHGLWCCDREGRARVLWTGTDPFVCAPVRETDRVFIATERELVCLRVGA
jgi:hypothetical protein